jgi:hypothetical protein
MKDERSTSLLGNKEDPLVYQDEREAHWFHPAGRYVPTVPPLVATEGGGEAERADWRDIFPICIYIILIYLTWNTHYAETDRKICIIGLLYVLTRTVPGNVIPSLIN